MAIKIVFQKWNSGAGLIRLAWREVCACWRDLFFYSLFFQLLSIAVLVPLTAGVAELVLARSGTLAVSNSAIAAFFLSPAGVLWCFVAATSYLILAYASSAGMLRIAWAGHRNQTISAAAALALTVRDLPRLARLAFRHVVGHGIRFVPFALLLGVIHQVFLSSYDIYYLVTETPPIWWFALSMATLVVGGACWVHGRLYLRWVLSLPVLVFEDQTPRQALARSEDAMQGQGGYVLRPIFLAGVLVALAPAVLTAFFDVAANLVFRVVPSTMVLLAPSLFIFAAAYLLSALVVGFLTLATSSFVIAHLYVAIDRDAAKEVEPQGETPLDANTMRRVSLASLTVLGLGLFCAMVYTGFIVRDMDFENDVEIAAHRGSSLRAPENSMPAIDLAIAEGADVCELDFQELGDGTIVMMHDTDFRRIAGRTDSVWEVGYDEVKDMDVGSWFGPEYSHLRLVTLEDVLQQTRGRIGLNLELKFHGHEKNFIANVIEILRDAGFKDRGFVSSLDIKALQTLRVQAPEFRTGAILAKTLGAPSKLDSEVLSVSARMATPGFIDSAHRAGKEVHVWTLNDRKQMLRFINLGVDSILTDDPLQLREILDERQALSREDRLLLRIRTVLLN